MMTEELGRFVLRIHAKVANTFPRFKGYSSEVKEEIQSAAIYKFVKYRVWEKLDPDKGSVFAYLTTCAFRNMLTALGNYYRDFNRKMEIVKNTIDELRQYFQNLKYQPRGWEEAVDSFQNWVEKHPTLRDEEEENEAT